MGEPPAAGMLDPELTELVRRAALRLESDLLARAPEQLAGRVAAWARRLAQSADPVDYFLNPVAFPMFALPWWVEHWLQPEPDLALQADLAYSTMCGYYYIRLLDNLMDGHAADELTLLPAAGFFHTQFQLAYQAYFDGGHPFWQFFAATWLRAADLTMVDALSTEWDEASFRRVAGQKTSAVKIPMAAVWHRHLGAERGGLEAWLSFADRLGAWHQMCNDVFDWNKDMTRGTPSYFLSEAERRRRPAESVAGWVAREGFDWGLATLHAWLAEARAAGQALGSAGLLAYLDRREAWLHRQQAETAAGLRGLARLAEAMPTR